MSNLNNWQHALSYPGFMLSALVDIAGAFVPLPPGASQVRPWALGSGCAAAPHWACRDLAGSLLASVVGAGCLTGVCAAAGSLCMPHPMT